MTKFFSRTKQLMFSTVLLLCCTGLYAQHEFWGTMANGGAHGKGYIFRTNSTGDSLEIKYDFDSVHGSSPGGRFVTSSNGKLYGITGQGGTQNRGVLYEYDMRTDSLKVLYNFNLTSPEFPYGNPDVVVGLTQSSPGILWGACSQSRWVFKYNVNTGIMQLAFMVPNFIGGSAGLTQFNGLTGPLYKAPDGFLYGTTYAFSQCPMGFPNAGSIIRINPTTNAFNLVHPYACTAVNGWNPNGDLVETSGGNMYSMNEWGGLYGAGPSSPGNGTIYLYNRITNTYTKKYDFDGLTGFRPAAGLTLAQNGKFYGFSGGGGTPSTYHPYGSGVLFEFDPATDVLTKKHEFVHISGLPDTSIGILPQGTSMVAATNGKLYGQTNFGIYEYDIPTNKLRAAGRYPSILPAYPSLAEVCRPPAYVPFSDSVFTLCEGSFFRFDPHNLNATTVVWTQNGIVSPAHTNDVLEFETITLADAGTWKCTLTNECGTTKLFALHITVNAATPGTVSSVLTPADTTMICPGTAITLNGNNGGTWNTGATSASISVTQPGWYQVVNNNSCGEFYSNIVVIDTITSPQPIAITAPNTYLCYGTPVVLSGNVPGGVWNTGATTPTITVPADSVTQHYVTLAHSCGTDTSNIIMLPGWTFYHEDPFPVIDPAGPTHFCSGGSLTLFSNKPFDSPWTWTWYRIHPFGSDYLGYDNSITVTTSGMYIISQISVCGGTVESDTLEVIVDPGVPATPLIFADGPTTFCEGGDVILETTGSGGSWSNGNTGTSTTISTSGIYSYTSANLCGTTTSATIMVNVLPAPVITWTQSPDSICVSSSPVSLSGQSPAGGIFLGPSVSGGAFDPAAAGLGQHVLTYTYTDFSGCSASVTQTVVVEGLPTAPVIYNGMGPVTSALTICEGDSLLLFPVPVTYGLWNNGETYPILYAKDAGVYNFTVTNSCGSSISNDFTLSVNPIPVISWLPLPDSVCHFSAPVPLGTPTPAGGTFEGTGVSGSIFDPSLAVTGTNTIEYTYSDAAGCSATAEQEIYVASDTVYITAMGPTSFCEGDSVQLQSNTPGNWSNGEIGNQVNVSETGTYTVTTTGCGSSITASIDITVWLNDQVNNPQTICDGDNYAINGNVYNVPGTYVDTLQKLVTGCDSIVTTVLTIEIPNITVTQDDITLTAASGYTYQWVDCDEGHSILTGETAQDFSATENGNYAVIVTGAAGCTDTSMCYLVNPIGVMENDGLFFSVYPNPVTDIVYIKTNVNIENIAVLDMAGKQVLAFNSTPIDMAVLSRGTYTLRVKTPAGYFRQKLVKL